MKRYGHVNSPTCTELRPVNCRHIIYSFGHLPGCVRSSIRPSHEVVREVGSPKSVG